MSTLFRHGPFTSFGPSAFLPAPDMRVVRTADGKSGKLRSQVRQLAPRQPGVYGMVDAHDELIYVGKAKNLRARLLSYFRPRSRPRKAAKVLAQAIRILWQVCPGEFPSLLRELELIRRWRPRCNVQGQPLRRRHTFICLGRKPAPYAFLAPNPPRTATRTSSARSRPTGAHRKRCGGSTTASCCAIVRRRSRSSSPIRANSSRRCARRAVCVSISAPAWGPAPASVHARHTRALSWQQPRFAFLAGTDPGPVPILQQLMEDAAQAATGCTSRAALHASAGSALQWLAGRLERLRYARQSLSFVYPVAGPDGVQTWYLIHGARTLAAVPAPGRSSRQGTGTPRD